MKWANPKIRIMLCYRLAIPFRVGESWFVAVLGSWEIRMRRFLFALAALAASIVSPPALAEDLRPIPQLKARATDQAGALSPSELSALESRLAEIERSSKAQLAVLIVETTAPEAIEQYALRVAEAWRLGREREDDGALLLVAVKDRAMRLEIGYGLEGAIPDAVAKRIIAETIAPRFAAGRFAEGLMAGADRVGELALGEELSRGPSPKKDSSGAGWGVALALLAVALPLLLFAGIVVWAVNRSADPASRPRRRDPARRARDKDDDDDFRPPSSGGSSYSPPRSSSSSSGFGGFSGGGGGFGGGGASGKW